MQSGGGGHIDDDLGHADGPRIHPVRRQGPDHPKWDVVVYFHDDIPFFIVHLVDGAVVAKPWDDQRPGT